MAMTVDDLSQLPSFGIARTARKPHRCTCADPVWHWTVRRECEHGWSESRSHTENDAEAHAHRIVGTPCHGDKRPTEERVTITPTSNPNFRPDCLGDIAPGDRYWEYRGEAAMWESGTPYCARCAVAVWGKS